MAFRTVGVEIGTSGVRAVELALGTGTPALVNYGEVPLPPGAVLEGEIADRNIVTDRLKRLWGEADFSSNRVSVGVSGLRAIIREIQIAQVSDKELDEVVRFQAEDVIPFPIEQTLLSARVIGSFSGDGGVSQNRVLFAAAHRELVEPVIQVMEDANLIPIAVDLSALALVRSARAGLPEVAGAEAIVSIGAGLTMVVVHEAGIANFVRTIGQGGDKVTEAIASSLDAPFQDAEQIKWNLSLPGPQYVTAAAAARDATSALVNEVKSSVDYYNGLADRQNIERVLITGGGALLEGLLPRIQQQFRIPVMTAHPLSSIDISQIGLLPEDAARREPSMSTVLGLAIPEPQGVKPINLLPPEVTRKATLQKTRRYVFAGAALLLVLMVGWFGFQSYNWYNGGNTLASQKEQNNVLTAQIASLEQSMQTKARLTALEASVAPYLQDEVDWSKVYNEIVSKLDPAVAGTYILSIDTVAVASSGTASSAASMGASLGGPYTSATTILSDKVPIHMSQVIAVVSVNVLGLGGYTDFTSWVDAIEKLPMFTAPVVSSVQLVGSTASATQNTVSPVTFPATFGITTAALSSRATKYK
ncbi:MAG: type IV pilus assembly protein PilM [Acidimicrobiales bacterium]|nr:type IV pilus assembly protein PilM [Acidimicrobiales bacterium]